jgi:hypothetical protein
MQRIHRQGALAAGLALCLGFAATAQAQSTGSETGRNVAQQQRIEQGLQSGQLSTREARKLEQGEARIDRTEQRALADGSLSDSEKTRIRREQNRESAAIHGQKHDAQNGNPDSLRSNLEQANVQRNVNQEERIHNGVANGSMTNREAGRMEGRQAHVDHMEARSGTLRQTRRIQRTDNRDSRRIYRDKHNRRGRH